MRQRDATKYFPVIFMDPVWDSEKTGHVHEKNDKASIASFFGPRSPNFPYVPTVITIARHHRASKLSTSNGDFYPTNFLRWHDLNERAGGLLV
jgi:hypothetical protein